MKAWETARLASEDDADGSYMESVLRHHGLIEPADRVRRVTFERVDSQCSDSFRASVSTHSGRTIPLFLKLVRPSHGSFGSFEVDYYRTLTAEIANGPAPACLSYGLDAGGYHLLLEDVSARHRPRWGQAEDAKAAFGIADACARLHAPWWDHPNLENAAGQRLDEAAVERFVAEARPGLEPMLEAAANDISDSDAALIREAFLTCSAAMLDRIGKGNLTAVHGDLNPGNILEPIADGACYLIDRQPFDWSLRIWTGCSDLANAIVHWWTPEARLRLEETLVWRYVECLGRKEYDFDEAWQDYLEAIPMSLFTAAEWCTTEASRARMEWVWKPQLHRTLCALRDRYDPGGKSGAPVVY